MYQKDHISIADAGVSAKRQRVTPTRRSFAGSIYAKCWPPGAFWPFHSVANSL